MVITVGAEKGGVAKTRLATHIAAIAASQGVDVVLLDTDRQGSAVSWSRIRNDEGVLPSIPAFALPANPARELANLSSRYSLVVVDIGAQQYRSMLECAQLSDLVVVPCGPDQQEVESTLAVFTSLRDLDARHARGRVPAYCALTRVSTKPDAKATTELRAYLESEGVPTLRAHAAQREAWRATGKTGRALHELRGSDRSTKAIAEMQAMYDEIVELANHQD
jgi:chromosome partitioning protein